MLVAVPRRPAADSQRPAASYTGAVSIEPVAVPVAAAAGVRVFRASRFREGRWSGVLAAGLLLTVLAFAFTASSVVLVSGLLLATGAAAAMFALDDYSWVGLSPGELLIHRRGHTLVVRREEIQGMTGSAWRAGIGSWNDLRDITLVLATGEQVDLPASIRHADELIAALRGPAES